MVSVPRKIFQRLCCSTRSTSLILVSVCLFLAVHVLVRSSTLPANEDLFANCKTIVLELASERDKEAALILRDPCSLSVDVDTLGEVKRLLAHNRESHGRNVTLLMHVRGRFHISLHFEAHIYGYRMFAMRRANMGT